MILLNAHLIGARYVDPNQAKKQQVWPSKPSSNHHHYLICSAPNSSSSATEPFVDALSTRFDEITSLKQTGENSSLTIKEIIQELTDKTTQVYNLANACESCLLISFDSSGVTLAGNGTAQAYQLVGGEQWKAHFAGSSHSRLAEPLFVPVDEVTSKDYFLITTESLPDEFLEEAQAILSNQSKIAPFQRADKLSQLLNQYKPDLLAYLIGVLSTRAIQALLPTSNVFVNRPAEAPDQKPVTVPGKRQTAWAATGLLLLGVLAFGGYTLQGMWRRQPSNNIAVARPQIKAASIQQRVEPQPVAPQPTDSIQEEKPQEATAFVQQKIESVHPLQETKAEAVSAALNENTQLDATKTAREMRIKGKALYDKAQYQEAFSYYLQAAEQGDKYAQLYLGLMYARGLGTMPDSSKAYTWISKAALQNLPPAQRELSQFRGM